MLPPDLSTNVKQYREDTDYIATWLATTARSCGYVVSEVGLQNTQLQIAQLQAPERGPKLKGRARTVARRTGEASTAHTNPSPASSGTRKVYILATKHYLPMASRIATSTRPSIQLPASLQRALDRAISLRESVASAIINIRIASKSRDAVAERSDDDHAFFIRILRNVRDVLKDKWTQSLRDDGKKNRTTQQQKSTVQDYINTFASLETVDSASITDSEHGTQETISTVEVSEFLGRQEIIYKAEKIDDFAEAVTAFQCLLQDLQHLEAGAKSCWRKYKDEECDLLSAGLANNLAMELARQVEEELDCFQAYGGTERFIKDACIARRTRAQGTPGHIAPQGEVQEGDSYCTLSETMHWPAYEAIRAHLDALHSALPQLTDLSSVPKHQLPLLCVEPASQNAKYNPGNDREALSDAEKCQQDRTILGAIVSDLCLKSAMNLRDTPVDEFQRGLEEAFRTRHVPMWLVAAGQILLNTAYSLGPKCTSGFVRVSKICTMIQHSILSLVQLHKNTLQVPVPPHLSKPAADLLEWATFRLEEDPIQNLRQSMSGADRTIARRFRLEELHPTLCGLWALQLQGAMHELSLKWVNEYGIIMGCAHLHNLLYVEKHLPEPWDDMGLLLFLQDRAHMFAGEPLPKTVEECFKRYCVAIQGFSATMYAKNRRRPEELILRQGRGRRLQSQAKLLMMFKSHYRNKERSSIKLDEVLRLRKVNLWQFAQFTGTTDDGKTLRGAHSLIQADPQMDQRINNARRHARSNLTAAVWDIFAAFSGEAPELAYDYLRMHGNCIRLLLALKETVYEHIRHNAGEYHLARLRHIERGNRIFALDALIGYIIPTTRMSQVIRSGVDIPMKTENVEALLTTLGNLFEKFINGPGSVKMADGTLSLARNEIAGVIMYTTGIAYLGDVPDCWYESRRILRCLPLAIKLRDQYLGRGEEGSVLGDTGDGEGHRCGDQRGRCQIGRRRLR